MSNGRADKGGQVGVNGATYQGGQFLPSHEDIEKGRYKYSVQQRDPLTPEQLAKIAQEEAEAQERTARNAAIAQEPHNRFLIGWLETYATPRTRAFRPSIGWQTIHPDRVPEDATETEQFLDWTFCSSDFLRSIHANLALYGKRPVDLSDKQFNILADIWVKAQGARKGSKRWEVLWNEFCDKALPEDY